MKNPNSDNSESPKGDLTESVVKILTKPLNGESWHASEIDNIDYDDAFQIVTSRVYETLPAEAKETLETIVVEYIDGDVDIAAAMLTHCRDLPARVIAEARRIVPMTPALKKSIHAQLRAEAFNAWKIVKDLPAQTSQPQSKPLLAKFGVSKAALAAIFANFRMGRIPA